MSDYALTGGELKHYGVVGMKWGVRRARKKGQNYVYKSHGQKKWERKLTKAKSKKETSAKIDKAEANLKRFKNRDRNRQDYAATTTAGKSVAKVLLMGPFGAGNYNRLRAAGHGRVASYKESNILKSTLGLPMQLIMSRDEEFRAAK